MKANELRIGNWYHWHSEGKYYEYQVAAKDFSNRNHENFEPIPLTEEWLLKMGFEDVNFKGTYGFQFLDMCLSIYKSYGVWRIVFEKADRMLKIKYVHQLQNLYFALTGQELTLSDG